MTGDIMNKTYDITMVYYMIRHKASGEFMPELKRGRGYSHWNPAATDELNQISIKKYTGTPRLFPSMRVAKQCIVQWNALPNAKNVYSDDGFDIDIKPDGRKKEDLEVVIVNIEETGVIT